MAQSPELVRVFKGHGEGVSGAIFHPLMHQLVSAGGDGKLFVWHFKQSLRPFKFHHHTAAVNDLAVSKDGSFFASAGSDKVVNLWTNNAHGAPSHSMKAHTAAVRSCHFSRDNFMLATGSDDKVVKVWQVTPTSSRFLTSFDGHSHWVRSVRFSQDDSNLLVTTSDDKSVRIWDVRIGGTAERGGCGGKGRSP